jgi:lipopolysaccharide/colanic/teichoic acid biosynthesis glycosyltransferase
MSRRIQMAIKRAFDIVVSSTILIILSPLIALITLAIRLTMGLPVLFHQTRPGYKEQPFTILKFRTMTEDRYADGNLLPDSDRLTPLGRFLRSTTLDELPELINVLRGEMSLVGPRPLLMRYYPYYTEKERARFDVLPGMTGLAFVSGRNDLPWDERLALDTWYSKNWSLALDAKILLLTVHRVITKRGFQVDPGAVMLSLDEERKLRGAESQAIGM